MKRSPLKRGKPMDRRSAPLRRTGWGTRGNRKSLKTPTWKPPKEAVKTGTCRHCGAEGPTDFHHAVHRSLSRAGRDNPLNLVELCRRCHDAHHAGVPLPRSIFTAESWAFIETLIGPGWLARHYPRDLEQRATDLDQPIHASRTASFNDSEVPP